MSLEHSPARQRRNIAAAPAPAQAAYTIPEFCVAHRISRSALYEMWKRGIGPRRAKTGTGPSSKVIITGEAAADFRRDLEAATEQKVT